MKVTIIFTLLMVLSLLAPRLVEGQEYHLQRMTPVYPASARVHDSIMAVKVPLLEFPEAYRHRQLPASVDNSKNSFWPGIQDQYLFYSCQQYSGVAYTFGYEINRMRNQPGWFWENRYPTHYTWNFLNLGERYVGVNFLQSFDVIKQQGHMTMSDYGMDTITSVLGWISGYDKYYRGMFNRLKGVYAIEVNCTEGINILRNYLYDHLDGSPNGGIACYTTSSGTLYGMMTLPEGTPEAGKHIITSWQPDPVHGLTVVGYHDSIRFDVNLDGKYTNNIDITGDGITDARDWETGGFKIANSYGNWWSDTGFVYALYRSFALSYGEGGIWNNRVYVVDADIDYQPLLTLKVNLDYNTRNKIRIRAGVNSDTLAQMPAHIMDFPIFNFQGGEHAMQGNDTLPEARSIEFGLDVTSLLSFVPSGQPARFFMIIEERDPDHAGQGTIQSASFINYRDVPVEFPVPLDDVTIKDNSITMVSAVAVVSKPNVKIETESLPPFNAAEPVQVQLEATGGRPPYEWSLVEDYFSKPVNTPEPQVGGTSILVPYNTRYFASVALPFSFPFYGQKFDSIYVNYFGFISFSPQNLPAPYITDEPGMLRMFPLIVPAFSQNYAYMANKNDGIWFEADASHAIIRWKVSVSPYVTSSTNDFAVILYPDGRFEFCYGTMDNQGFEHRFYKGVSKGDDQNFDVETQWNANELSGKSFLFYPPVIPGGVTLNKSGLLSVTEADSTVIYGLKVRAADAGRIADTKVLMLSSGLEILQELISGTDGKLKTGQPASLKLVLTNRTQKPLQNLVLKLRTSEPALWITDSSLVIPLLNPGQSLTVPSVFSFRLIHKLPNSYPVLITLNAQSLSNVWKKDLIFRVAAPEIVVESPYIADGFNERLDPGEVANLIVNIRNSGALACDNLQLQLISAGPVISVVSDSLVSIDKLDVNSASEFQFQLKALRNALPGSAAPMQIQLTDSSGILHLEDFTLQIGTRPVAIASLSTSQVSAMAMRKALDSLHVGYDTLSSLPFDYSSYASIFLILGTSNTGTHPLTEYEGTTLASFLQHGGNLYMEGYNAWYYLNNTALHPMFKYTSKKIPAYFYPEVMGTAQTFTDSMFFAYTEPVNYAVFSFEPVEPAFSTIVNTGNPPRNLEIAYDGNGYKTIGSMLNFGGLSDELPPSTKTTLMQRYLEFFDLNITGPFPLFHAAAASVCRGQAVTFTDDSFNNITSRSWEFPGGTPAASNDSAPMVRYNETGKFDVKLTVSDGTHTKTILKQKYIRVSQCTLTEDLPAPSFARIYPNPATDQITVEFDRNAGRACQLMLFDLSGRLVMVTRQVIPENRQVSVALSDVRKGLYFLRVQSGDFFTTLKLVRN